MLVDCYASCTLVYSRPTSKEISTLNLCLDRLADEGSQPCYYDIVSKNNIMSP